MPRIVKNNAVLLAERVEVTISAPGPGGDEIPVATPGYWALWKETDDGVDFVGFISDKEYRERHRPLVG